jgi:hypothetical protein
VVFGGGSLMVLLALVRMSNFGESRLYVSRNCLALQNKDLP